MMRELGLPERPTNQTCVVVRPDQQLSFGHVYDFYWALRDAGYRRVEISYERAQ